MTKKEILNKILIYNKKWNNEYFKHNYKNDEDLINEFEKLIDNNPNALTRYITDTRLNWIIKSDEFYTKNIKQSLYAAMDLLYDITIFLNERN